MKINKSISVTVLLSLCLLFLSACVIFTVNILALWLDEAAVALVITRPFPEVFHHALTDIHPMFYIFLIKIWSVMFGIGEISLRLFSSVWGFLTVILLFFSGLDMFRSKKIGILAAFAGATNYMVYWFSTQARPYTMVAFWGLLSEYFFIRLLKREMITNKFDATLYIFITALSFYVHVFMGLVFMSQVVTVLYLRWIRKDNPGKIIPIILITGILGIPAVALYIIQNRLFGASLWIEKITFTTIAASLLNISWGNTLMYILVLLYIPVMKLISIFRKSYSGFLTLTVSTYIRKKHLYEKLSVNFVALFSYLFLPYLTLIGISLYRPVYVPGRYEMIFLPAFLLILAYCMGKISQRYLLFLTLVMIGVFSLKAVMDRRGMEKSYVSNDRTVMRQILEKLENRDTVIATDLSFATMKYYASRLDVDNSMQITYVSYPVDTMVHPGFKTHYDPVEDKEMLIREAGALIDAAEGKGSRTVAVLLRTVNPLNQILMDKFSERNYRYEVIYPPLPREPSWFDAVLLFSRK